MLCTDYYAEASDGGSGRTLSRELPDSHGHDKRSARREQDRSAGEACTIATPLKAQATDRSVR